jgi:hypothetical protein
MKKATAALEGARSGKCRQRFSCIPPVRRRHNHLVYRLRVASDEAREAIYRLRHEVYATELKQYPEDPSGRLTDSVDAYNTYIEAIRGDELVGFVSVTPAGAGRYAVEKYYPRSIWPFDAGGVFETRLIAVRADHRGESLLLIALAYAAFRWARHHGAQRLITNAHRRMKAFYTLSGMTSTGLVARAGELDLELMTGTVEAIQSAMHRLAPMLRDAAALVQWEIGIPNDGAQ